MDWPSVLCDCVEVTTPVLARQYEDQIEWQRLSRPERLRDSGPTIGLVLVPVLVVISALLVLWMREPDPVSAGPARATLARLGTPVAGATLRSQFTADWPRCGTDGACITAVRVYQLTRRLTLGAVVQDLQAWAVRGRLGLADADPAVCGNLSPSPEGDKAPGPNGPGCVLGVWLPDQPNQRLSVNIMFEDAVPLARPQPGESWTKYEATTVAQVVIDVTNIRTGTD
jgi:hypothetical protein